MATHLRTVDAEQPSRRPLLTLRVSRDSGRTWGPLREIDPAECEPLWSSAWPLCECPRCRERETVR